MCVFFMERATVEGAHCHYYERSRAADRKHLHRDGLCTSAEVFNRFEEVAPLPPDKNPPPASGVLQTAGINRLRPWKLDSQVDAVVVFTDSNN